LRPSVKERMWQGEAGAERMFRVMTMGANMRRATTWICGQDSDKRHEKWQRWYGAMVWYSGRSWPFHNHNPLQRMGTAPLLRKMACLSITTNRNSHNLPTHTKQETRLSFMPSSYVTAIQKSHQFLVVVLVVVLVVDCIFVSK
jgi:hypothetical protein